MAYNIDYFDKLQLLKIIGRKLRKIAKDKKINLEDWANNGTGFSQGDLSNILNGRRGVSTEKLKVIAEAIGINEKELDKIVVESKKDELKMYGEDINLIPELNINTLADLDFDNDEIIKVLMHKELGKEPTPHDIEMIKMAIKMVKEKEKNKS